MRAGKLDTMITIERTSVTLDAYGTPTEATSTVVSTRAQVIQASTEEFLRGQGATDETLIVFRTRWIPDVKTADRLIHAGRAHNIREVKQIGRRKGLEIRTVAQGEA